MDCPKKVLASGNQKSPRRDFINWLLWRSMKARVCLCVAFICFGCSLVTAANFRGGGGSDYGIGANASHEVHVLLTDLKLTHFTHRGSLHVDRIELRSEDNGRNAFHMHNPSDPRYPLWAAAKASVGSVWPKPKVESLKSNRIFIIAEKFYIRFLGSKDDVMTLAAQRCAQHLFKSVTTVSDKKTAHLSDLITIDGVKISVRNANFQRYPHLGMREDYEIIVTGSGIQLLAQENWGVIRGLETLAQLIFVTRDRPNKFFIHENRITDSPAYEHRGLMIDTARHFIKKSTLLENLEAMSINKMNVFHWHIVDDQSFPYLSPKFPHLAMKSAYPGSAYFYTVKDIKDIVEFARLRGIRVIPEFDTPDHTHSWGHGMPHIMSWCNMDGLAYMGPLNPTMEDTFTFLKEFFTEVTQLFPDNYIHLGMDEVSTDCWRLNTSFNEFMNKAGIKSFEQLVSYYSNRLTDIITNLPNKKRIIVWEDILNKDSQEYPLKLPPDTIVQVWITQDTNTIAEWAKKYKILRSKEWYLDQQAYGADWVKRYQFTIDNHLGGEACMWTEYQSDETLTPHIWPSVSAVAERLWSGSIAVDVVQAAPRIEEQNCRLQARGIRSGVAGGPGMCQAPVGRYRPPWRLITGLGDASIGDWEQLVQVNTPIWYPVSQLDDFVCWVHKFSSILMAAYLIYKSQVWRQLHPTLRGNTGSLRQFVSSYLSLCIDRRFYAAMLSRPGGIIYIFLSVYFVFWLVVTWYT